jgi:hypothetical protein
MININTGDIIGKAFDFAKSYGLPMAAILFAANAIGGLLGQISGLSSSEEVRAGGSLLFSILQLGINALVTVSIFASILKILRENGGSYSFDHGLSVSVYVKFAVCQFIYGLAVVLGFAFFIVPGVFIAVRWVFAPLYLIDHPNAGIGEALQASWNKTEGLFWPLFGLGLAATIVTISGILLCCIGLYFTMIIAYVAQVMTYRMLWNDEQEGADEDQFVRFGRDDLYV